LKHADLGWDYIEASRSERTRQAYLSGVCRFHDHKGVAYQNGSLAPCDGCPYAQDECYPRGEEEGAEDVQAVHVNGVEYVEEGLEPVEEVDELEEEPPPSEEPVALEERGYPPDESAATEEPSYPDEETATEAEPFYPAEEEPPAEPEEPASTDYPEPPADGVYTPVAETQYPPAEEMLHGPSSNGADKMPVVEGTNPAEEEIYAAEEAAPSESVPEEANGTVGSDKAIEERDRLSVRTLSNVSNGVETAVEPAVTEVEMPKFGKKKKHNKKNKQH